MVVVVFIGDRSDNGGAVVMVMVMVVVEVAVVEVVSLVKEVIVVEGVCSCGNNVIVVYLMEAVMVLEDLNTILVVVCCRSGDQ